MPSHKPNPTAVATVHAYENGKYSLRAEAGLSRTNHSQPDQPRLVISVWLPPHNQPKIKPRLWKLLSGLWFTIYNPNYARTGRLTARLPLANLDQAPTLLAEYVDQAKAILAQAVSPSFKPAPPAQPPRPPTRRSTPPRYRKPPPPPTAQPRRWRTW